MTKANRKKIAKELLAAAERIATFEENFCCNAIRPYEALRYFIDIFRDDAQALDDYTAVAWFCQGDEQQYSAEARSRRILGLCWAALMAEEGVF